MASRDSASSSAVHRVDSSTALARHALLTMGILAMAGSGLGVFGILKGTLTGLEAVLVAGSLVFATGVVVRLLLWRTAAVQIVATVSTVYCTLHLCAASIVAVIGAGQHLNVFIYFVWFFPLLVFNKLVNAPAIGRALSLILRILPVLICCALSARLIAIFSPPLLLLLVAFCLAYISFGSMLDVVTRYCEEFIVQRERAETLKVESAVLESISDCFISLDSALRLVYLNDAACAEFAVERQRALKEALAHAVPGFCSQSMLEELRSASGNARSSTFEAQNEAGGRWYEMRCFPRPDGMSIYFLNIVAPKVRRSTANLARTGRTARQGARRDFRSGSGRAHHLLE
jgi:PAS domain-containing protein